MVQIIACVASSFSTDWNTAVSLLTLPGHTGLADPPTGQDNQPESSHRALDTEAIFRCASSCAAPGGQSGRNT